MSIYANEARTHVCMRRGGKKSCCSVAVVMISYEINENIGQYRSADLNDNHMIGQCAKRKKQRYYLRTGLIFCVQFFFFFFILWIAPFKFITQYLNDDHRFLFIDATKTHCIHSILTISFHVFNDIIAGFCSEISFGIH